MWFFINCLGILAFFCHEIQSISIRKTLRVGQHTLFAFLESLVSFPIFSWTVSISIGKIPLALFRESLLTTLHKTVKNSPPYHFNPASFFSPSLLNSWNDEDNERLIKSLTFRLFPVTQDVWHCLESLLFDIKTIISN